MNYLQNLWNQFDFVSLSSYALRIAAVLLCLTVHETCHGLAAYALGDPTAKRMHRLSLNPLRHIDWLGLAMMFFVGFGWAKPVPVDMRYFKKPKEGMAITALAGPASNFLLAVLLLLACKVVLRYISYITWAYPLLSFLVIAAQLSIGLGLFNLIPVPPLDGSRVLTALLPDAAYYRLMRYERFGILLLLVLSLTGTGSSVIGRAIGGVFQWLVSLCVPELLNLLR